MEFFAEYYDILENCFSVPVQGRARRASSLTEAGEATLPHILSARRMELYWPILWERMRPELEEKFPLSTISAGAVSRQARQEAFCRVLEDAARDGGAALYAEYPERHFPLHQSGGRQKEQQGKE